MTQEEIAAEALAASRQAEEKIEYTADELKGFTPTSEIDMERVPEPFRPVIENMTRDYKALQTDHTRKSQELAELKKTPQPDEKYFSDTAEDTVFKNFLKDPSVVTRDFNEEIRKLARVIPEDGRDEYRDAQERIAYLRGVKDSFIVKKTEMSDRRRDQEVSEAKLTAELGTDAASLLEYATKGLGYSETDFRSNPSLRTAIKKTYSIANADKSAQKKETKETPQKTAKTAGESGERGSGNEVLEENNPNLSSAERIDAMRKRRGTAG